MLRSLFKRRETRVRHFEAPPDTVVWAVGDIHGRRDLLDRLLSDMMQDLSRSAASRRVLVFLGDYVDRGPDSRGVIDRLCWLAEQPGLESHFIRGNHEDRMEAFLTDPEVGAGWCDYGGREALRSYGVEAPQLRADMEGWTAASKALNAALPESHRRFLRDQVSSVEIGDYFFAHAGARPGVSLAEQDPSDLMWVRAPFLDHAEPFERMVVHGHTPTEAVHADHRRIGIDTGAYATGVLSGLRLEGSTRELMQTRQAGRDVQVSRTPL